jgi:hypothetical protein
VDLSPKRSAGGSVKLAVLFPRGALRSAPLETTLWADVGGAELSLRLERTTPGAPASELHAWTVAPARRQARLELPGPALAALTAGTYRLSVSSGSDEGLSAEFTILDAAQARSVVEALDAATRGFDADDPAAEFLRADLLLSRGLLVEALATAARARQSVGDRREVARVVLSALERAGLRDVGPWIEWAALHLRSER